MDNNAFFGLGLTAAARNREQTRLSESEKERIMMECRDATSNREIEEIIDRIGGDDSWGDIAEIVDRIS